MVALAIQMNDFPITIKLLISMRFQQLSLNKDVLKIAIQNFNKTPNSPYSLSDFV